MNPASQRFPVLLRPGEDGWILAECPLLSGCFSQGRTRDEALHNIREVIELCLEAREEDDAALAGEYEIVDVAVPA